MDKNFLLAIAIFLGLIDCAIVANKKGYVLSNPFYSSKDKEMDWMDNSPNWKPKDNIKKEEEIKKEENPKEDLKSEEKPNAPEKKQEKRLNPWRNSPGFWPTIILYPVG